MYEGTLLFISYVISSPPKFSNCLNSSNTKSLYLLYILNLNNYNLHVLY